jgi:ABC-type Co2+ transport system permease subunit
MSRAAFPLLAYACLLSALAVVLWVWDDHWLPPTMLSVAAGAMTATAGVWVVQDRRLARTGEAADLRAVPNLSAATALLGFAIPTALVGSYLGVYLVLIGGGLIVLAFGGLVREALAVRRAARAQARPDAPPQAGGPP